MVLGTLESLLAVSLPQSGPEPSSGSEPAKVNDATAQPQIDSRNGDSSNSSNSGNSPRYIQYLKQKKNESHPQLIDPHRKQVFVAGDPARINHGDSKSSHGYHETVKYGIHKQQYGSGKIYRNEGSAHENDGQKVNHETARQYEVYENVNEGPSVGNCDSEEEFYGSGDESNKYHGVNNEAYHRARNIENQEKRTYINQNQKSGDKVNTYETKTYRNQEHEHVYHETVYENRRSVNINHENADKNIGTGQFNNQRLNKNNIANVNHGKEDRHNYDRVKNVNSDIVQTGAFSNAGQSENKNIYQGKPVQRLHVQAEGHSYAGQSENENINQKRIVQNSPVQAHAYSNAEHSDKRYINQGRPVQRSRVQTEAQSYARQSENENINQRRTVLKSPVQAQAYSNAQHSDTKYVNQGRTVERSHVQADAYSNAGQSENNNINQGRPVQIQHIVNYDHLYNFLRTHGYPIQFSNPIQGPIPKPDHQVVENVNEHLLDNRNYNHNIVRKDVAYRTENMNSNSDNYLCNTIRKMDYYGLADGTRYLTGNGRYVLIPGNDGNNHRYYDTVTGRYMTVRHITLPSDDTIVIVPGNHEPIIETSSSVNYGHGFHLGYEVYYLGNRLYRYENNVISAVKMAAIINSEGFDIPLTPDDLPLGHTHGTFPVHLAKGLYYIGNGNYRYHDQIISTNEILNFIKVKNINFAIRKDGYPCGMYDGTLGSVYSPKENVPVNLGNGLYFLGNGHYVYQDKTVSATHIFEFIKIHNLNVLLTQDGLPLGLFDGPLRAKRPIINLGNGIFYIGNGYYRYLGFVIHATRIHKFLKSLGIVISLTKDGYPTKLSKKPIASHNGSQVVVSVSKDTTTDTLKNGKYPINLGDGIFYLGNSLYSYYDHIVPASKIHGLLVLLKLKKTLPTDEEEEPTNSPVSNDNEGKPVDLGYGIYYIGKGLYRYRNHIIIASKMPELLKILGLHITLPSDAKKAAKKTSVCNLTKDKEIDLGHGIVYLGCNQYKYLDHRIPVEHMRGLLKILVLNIPLPHEKNDISTEAVTAENSPKYLGYGIYKLGKEIYRYKNFYINSRYIVEVLKILNLRFLNKNQTVIVSNGHRPDDKESLKKINLMLAQNKTVDNSTNSSKNIASSIETIKYKTTETTDYNKNKQTTVVKTISKSSKHFNTSSNEDTDDSDVFKGKRSKPKINAGGPKTPAQGSYDKGNDDCDDVSNNSEVIESNEKYIIESEKTKTTDSNSNERTTVTKRISKSSKHFNTGSNVDRDDSDVFIDKRARPKINTSGPETPTQDCDDNGDADDDVSISSEEIESNVKYTIQLETTKTTESNSNKPTTVVKTINRSYEHFNTGSNVDTDVSDVFQDKISKPKINAGGPKKPAPGPYDKYGDEDVDVSNNSELIESNDKYIIKSETTKTTESNSGKPTTVVKTINESSEHFNTGSNVDTDDSDVFQDKVRKPKINPDGPKKLASGSYDKYGDEVVNVSNNLEVIESNEKYVIKSETTKTTESNSNKPTTVVKTIKERFEHFNTGSNVNTDDSDVFQDKVRNAPGSYSKNGDQDVDVSNNSEVIESNEKYIIQSETTKTTESNSGKPTTVVKTIKESSEHLNTGSNVDTDDSDVFQDKVRKPKINADGPKKPAPGSYNKNGDQNVDVSNNSEVIEFNEKYIIQSETTKTTESNSGKPTTVVKTIKESSEHLNTGSNVDTDDSDVFQDKVRKPKINADGPKKPAPGSYNKNGDQNVDVSNNSKVIESNGKNIIQSETTKTTESNSGKPTTVVKTIKESSEHLNTGSNVDTDDSDVFQDKVRKPKINADGPKKPAPGSYNKNGDQNVDVSNNSEVIEFNEKYIIQSETTKTTESNSGKPTTVVKTIKESSEHLNTGSNVDTDDSDVFQDKVRKPKINADGPKKPAPGSHNKNGDENVDVLNNSEVIKSNEKYIIQSETTKTTESNSGKPTTVVKTIKESSEHFNTGSNVDTDDSDVFQDKVRNAPCSYSKNGDQDVVVSNNSEVIVSNEKYIIQSETTKTTESNSGKPTTVVKTIKESSEHFNIGSNVDTDVIQGKISKPKINPGGSKKPAQGSYDKVNDDDVSNNSEVLESNEKYIIKLETTKTTDNNSNERKTVAKRISKSSKHFNTGSNVDRDDSDEFINKRARPKINPSKPAVPTQDCDDNGDVADDVSNSSEEIESNDDVNFDKTSNSKNVPRKKLSKNKFNSSGDSKDDNSYDQNDDYENNNYGNSDENLSKTDDLFRREKSTIKSKVNNSGNNKSDYFDVDYDYDDYDESLKNTNKKSNHHHEELNKESMHHESNKNKSTDNDSENDSIRSVDEKKANTKSSKSKATAIKKNYDNEAEEDESLTRTLTSVDNRKSTTKVKQQTSNIKISNFSDEEKDNNEINKTVKYNNNKSIQYFSSNSKSSDSTENYGNDNKSANKSKKIYRYHSHTHSKRPRDSGDETKEYQSTEKTEGSSKDKLIYTHSWPDKRSSESTDKSIIVILNQRTSKKEKRKHASKNNKSTRHVSSNESDSKNTSHKTRNISVKKSKTNSSDWKNLSESDDNTEINKQTRNVSSVIESNKDIESESNENYSFNSTEESKQSSASRHSNERASRSISNSASGGSFPNEEESGGDEEECTSYEEYSQY